jgi:hypothetical protein
LAFTPDVCVVGITSCFAHNNKEKKLCQSTQAVETNQEYRSIAIAILVESPTNPRKGFDEKTLAEPESTVPAMRTPAFPGARPAFLRAACFENRDGLR